MVGRLLTVAVAIVLLTPAQGSAQRLGTSTTPPVVIRQNPPAPPPPSRPVVNPLQQRSFSQPQPIPPIALMSPTINTFPLGTVDLYQARRRGFGRFGRNPGFDQGYVGGGYYGDYGGYYGYGLPYVSDLDLYMREGVLPARQNTGNEPFGYLRLQVQPADAQVFVDGVYAGIVDDFDGVSAGRAFNAGPHRVEIRANGFESHTFDVRVPANSAISYVRSLDRVEQRAEFRAPPAVPKTFYVIPRCYAGTTKPRADQLPRGCNAKDVRVVPPVVDGK
jgi:hypothetical protein